MKLHFLVAWPLAFITADTLLRRSAYGSSLYSGANESLHFKITFIGSSYELMFCGLLSNLVFTFFQLFSMTLMYRLWKSHRLEKQGIPFCSFHWIDNLWHEGWASWNIKVLFEKYLTTSGHKCLTDSDIYQCPYFHL